jgi:SAM-dependent methyltransferase
MKDLRTGLRLRFVQPRPRAKTLVAPIRRIMRDAPLLLRASDQVEYYRAIMRADARRGHAIAIGSPTEESWLRIGALQFEYLREHGLEPGSRMLEIGCGNLRAGRHFIAYLDPAHYHAVELSPEILAGARETIRRDGLQDRLPHLSLVDGLTLDFLPAGYFDVVHAHSVIPHLTPRSIGECMAGVKRVLAPGGFFDFTFDRVQGAEFHVLWEDYHYRAETLLAAARRHGLEARLMEDWERVAHRQSKIRATHAVPSGKEDR